jgi:hypothetical protein
MLGRIKIEIGAEKLSYVTTGRSFFDLIHRYGSYNDTKTEKLFI